MSTEFTSLPSSGVISASQVMAEFGEAGPSKASDYYGLGTLPASGSFSASDFYGQDGDTAARYLWQLGSSISGGKFPAVTIELYQDGYNTQSSATDGGRWDTLETPLGGEVVNFKGTGILTIAGLGTDPGSAAITGFSSHAYEVLEGSHDQYTDGYYETNAVSGYTWNGALDGGTGAWSFDITTTPPTTVQNYALNSSAPAEITFFFA